MIDIDNLSKEDLERIKRALKSMDKESPKCERPRIKKFIVNQTTCYKCLSCLSEWDETHEVKIISNMRTSLPVVLEEVWYCQNCIDVIMSSTLDEGARSIMERLINNIRTVTSKEGYGRG